MNPALFQIWPALVAGAVGASVPKDKSLRSRLGLGLVAALAALFVQAVWPTPASPDAAEPTEWPHLLTALVALPLVGAVVVLFLPRHLLSLLRGFTLAVLGIGFVMSLQLLQAPMGTGWHYVQVKEWIPAFGIRYHVAVDGISLWLILLTTFVTPVAVYASFGSIKTRIKELCFSYLLLQGAMLGAFVALDLFLFYLFWELMLVPMFIMIGIWGGAEKIKASIKFFLYTMVGSVLMLAAILYVVHAHHSLTGVWTFDYLSLSRVVLPSSAQMLCFWAFSLAFFIKVPMWPVHTWLPDAHVQAPTGGSVILAAVMLKIGTYAYMRFSMGMFPAPAAGLSANLAGVAILGGIVYGALVAWKQRDIKKLVAYSSVAHLGYVMLGLFGATSSGMQGAVLQMVNHGVSTGALFLLIGVLYDRRHTREVSEFGGIAKVMPVYAALFVIVTFSSIGVPGTNGFVGEFMVITGTYVSTRLGNFAGVHTVGAALGVILAAVYMLSVVQKTFFGPLTNPKNKHLTDISPREVLALSPLVAMVFVIGFFPNVFLDRMRPAVAAFADRFEAHAAIAARADDREARFVPKDQFPAYFLVGAPVIPAEEEPAEPKPEAAAPAAAAPAGAPGGLPGGALDPGARPRPGGPPPTDGPMGQRPGSATEVPVRPAARAPGAPQPAQPAGAAPRQIGGTR
jgi:NADH-quinone oxidoreductase subunit M